jgi:phosphomannomutase/phosphoglucomutase
MTRLFGTNGIRWVVGERNITFAVRLGIDAGIFYGEGSTIAIGYDTRTSSPMILNAVVSGLLSSGCHTMNLGLVPTPLVQYAVKHKGYAGGLMVTASHNPPEFNGLKFFAADGTEISRPDEERIEMIHDSGEMPSSAWNTVGKSNSESHIQSDYRKVIGAILKEFNKSKSVVIDCANGAAIGYSPEIITESGCKVVTLNGHPDGRFPGRMPEPVRENVSGLMQAVCSHGADMGIAHDGDADRATFVDEKGNYVTGDQSLAIFAWEALERRGPGKIVVPINTSKMVEDIVTTNGGEIVYTAVGSPLIARRMMENGAIFGGEGNGGAIFSEHQYCRDGIMAAARMLCIISKKGPLSDIVSQLPKYSTKSSKLRMVPEQKERILEQVRKEAGERFSDIDGIKTDLDDGWTLVRASGTEPIIRITVETRSEELSNRILKERVDHLKEIIKGLS